MHTRKVLALAFVASSLVACAALLGIGDLTVDGGASVDASEASVSCGDAGTLDDCVGEGGVVLMLSGELTDLAWANTGAFSPGHLYATGWVEAGASSKALFIQEFPAPGEAGVQYPDKAGTYASAIALAPGYPPVIYVVGFGPKGGQVYSLDPDLVPSGPPTFLADASNMVVLDSRNATRDGTTLWYTGTVATPDGGVRGYVTRVGDTSITMPTIINAIAYLTATPPVLMFTGDSQNGGQPTAYFYDLTLSGASSPPITVPFGPGSHVWNALTSGSGFWVVGELADASGIGLTHIQDGAIDPSTGTVKLSGSGRRGRAVLVVGSYVYVGGSDQGKPTMARFALDGAVDTTFGDGGFYTLPFTGELRALVFDGVTHHVVAGGVVTSPSGGSQWLVAWFNY